MLQTLGKLWAAWKRIGRRIGDFQARVLLTLIYAVIILPFGLVVRLFSDPLNIKTRPANWLDHPKETIDVGWARHQG
jgi:hypothetical protein